jgi:isocitrate/isopropylmalate dehydrogenase
MTTITVIRGDGIGPEIMDATLHVLDAMQLGLTYEDADAGMVALEKHGELLPQATMDSIRKNKIALKSPLTTPVGGGFSSINVELRKRFDLYANVRPAKCFPNTKSRFSGGVDLITVRENTEGAYIGEGQNVSDDGETAVLTQKVTRKGSERILRVGAQNRPQESHDCAQGQYPEIHLGVVLEDRARSGGAVSRHRMQRDDCGQHLHAVGDAPRAVRHHLHHQFIWRHYF